MGWRRAEMKTTAEKVAHDKRVPILYLDLDGTVRKGKDELGRFVNCAEIELLTQRVQELEKALRIARGRMSHSYNCVKVNPTEEWHKDGSVTVGACICEIATVDAALAGTKEQP
jgi:hypothetical protein